MCVGPLGFSVGFRVDSMMTPASHLVRGIVLKDRRSARHCRSSCGRSPIDCPLLRARPSRSPFGSSFRFRDALIKEDEIPKGVFDEKLFETPRLGLQRRLNSIGQQILLIQDLTVGDSDPTNRAALWSVCVVIQVQIHPGPFDDGKMLVVTGASP